MKTKDIIKQQGRLLFNEFGVQNVTLRDIAKLLGKSYGNITYHFSSKELLITDLFKDMNSELSQITRLHHPANCLLSFFLKAPEYSFDITLKYLFLYKDYVELKRNYPVFIEEVDNLNSKRKSNWLKLLTELQKQEYLLSNLSIEDLEYIMELSISIRMFYFQNNKLEKFNKDAFTVKVNKLLYPYLGQLGKNVFDSKMPITPHTDKPNKT
ncbi:TetR/AcrR family transcriptional regulator [Flagellimonas pacifica]|uniref:Transcriptional regulator, TetR family n=1 Tax=Flagellimonas pacifica TaxID=1247520 RepID=A0A285MT33_9FLAO|nr:TetR/AcrR family transcriptional regulator [Allomuricauda parva]SNZ00350.1 transcriptional regulator, TetR family [Allomuricauda parva]